jgi:3-methylcrotonyl-CoA carboxylase alpha subunit
MGDKARARQTVVQQGVPVVPGYDGESQDDLLLQSEASRIGYPILVKATAGGGGRGLRRVDRPEDLAEALASARREAAGAFGNSRVLLERYVLQPRHIEVQVFADGFGSVVHLGERECSIQRRHQKVVEEAPSPMVTPAMRARMGQAACAAARAVGYVGAGTVEFIAAPSGEFYFLEMNTRLQVEHPVTELITGLDLVAWQIRVAEGGRLPKTQDEIMFRGHAIEVRLCAEDPLRDYLPATGRLLRVDLPESPEVRVDAGFYAGDEVSPYYDSLIAKVIAVGEDRPTATRRLRRALAEAWVPGVVTNLRLLTQILDHPLWAAADLDTAFLGRAGLPQPPPLHVARGVIAAVVLAHASHRGTDGVPPGFRLGGPAWQQDRYSSFGVEAIARWRSGPHGLEVEVRAGPDHIQSMVKVLGQERDGWRVEVDGVLHRWRMVTLDGGPVSDGSVVYVHLGDDVEAMVRLEPRHPEPAPPSVAPGTRVAPTPGRVVRVLVQPGDVVDQGQSMIVLEAMKMEHPVRADRAGTVASVYVEVGDAVAEGALLVQIHE